MAPQRIAQFVVFEGSELKTPLKAFPLGGGSASANGFGPDFNDACDYCCEMSTRNKSRCVVLRRVDEVLDEQVLAEYRNGLIIDQKQPNLRRSPTTTDHPQLAALHQTRARG